MNTPGRDGDDPIVEQLREARRALRDEPTGRMRALVDSDAMFRALMEALPFELWARDAEGRCIVQNPASIRRWGDQLGAVPAGTSVPAEVAAAWVDGNRRALAGEVVDEDYSVPVDGGYQDYRRIIAPIREGGRVRGTIGVNLDITDRRRAEQALAESERRYREMFVSNTAVKLLLDPEDGRIVDANPAAAEFYGWSLDQLRQMRITDINTMPAAEVRANLGRCREEERLEFEFKHRLASGEVRDVRVYSAPVHVDGKRLLFSILHDVTERNHLEEQLRLSQRMDAVGRLAGGVAHDFNNLIAVVLNYAAILDRRLPADAPGREELEQIGAAARRAADLTKRLLLFGRTELDAVAAADVNLVVAEVAGLFASSEGGGCSVKLELAPDAGGVGVVKSQLDQVVLNLLVNARDAMPEGGCVTISTRRLGPGPEQAAASGQPVEAERAYVELAVEDTGCGMTAEVAAHAFEPFFTTKPAGLGTGLGLSIVYGVVRRAGGRVAVYSEPGRGARFSILLPAARMPPERQG